MPKTTPKTEIKTREQRQQEKQAALELLRPLVHKVPANFGDWGVIRTRAWLAVNKKSAQALARKSGPSVNRCRALIAQYQEVTKADAAALNNIARGKVGT